MAGSGVLLHPAIALLQPMGLMANVQRGATRGAKDKMGKNTWINQSSADYRRKVNGDAQ